MRNQKRISIKVIAEMAKVSKGTVDRVIHNRSGVSKKTRDAVKSIIQELNYTPNIVASNLAKSKSLKIAVFLPKTSSKSRNRDSLLKGVQTAQNEIELLLVDVEIYYFEIDDCHKSRDEIEKFTLENYNGFVIVEKLNSKLEQLLTKCRIKKVPYVLVDVGFEESGAICVIQQNYYETGKLAAQLFNCILRDGEVLILRLENDCYSKKKYDKKEDGFLDYLNEVDSIISVIKRKMSNREVENIKTSLDEVLKTNLNVRGIFIPNSNIKPIADYLNKNLSQKVHLIGCNFLEENQEFVENGVIDFLICQKLEKLGYKAIFNLFKYCILDKRNFEKELVPIDIITKNNYKYY